MSGGCGVAVAGGVDMDAVLGMSAVALVKFPAELAEGNKNCFGFRVYYYNRYILSMLSPRFSGGLEQKMESQMGSYAIAFEIFLLVKAVANYVFKLSYFNEVFGKLGDFKRLSYDSFFFSGPFHIKRGNMAADSLSRLPDSGQGGSQVRVCMQKKREAIKRENIRAYQAPIAYVKSFERRYIGISSGATAAAAAMGL
ncbi:hypothetical protein DKX38_017246 [Salix brachista]|uniref:Uncharacterized protein n=1 Tax=Salix brachista TaxID=2182728 RepID=A0A5N5KUN4_9ROSI|nr:hypothetical protein DKX38_017246 [Salix brachista]